MLAALQLPVTLFQTSVAAPAGRAGMATHATSRTSNGRMREKGEKIIEKEERIWGIWDSLGGIAGWLCAGAKQDARDESVFPLMNKDFYQIPARWKIRGKTQPFSAIACL